MTRGCFITLEGGEGAGKSTQARLLADALRRRGVPVLLTREPGGSEGAEILRELLLSGRVNWSPPAEVLLHFAARAEHVEQTIRPALTSGTWVICDRFFDSTMAYQGYGQGADRAMITGLIALIGLIPDITIVLDVIEDVARFRLRNRGADTDHYEQMDQLFHARVKDGFRNIAHEAPARCVLLSADGDEAAVHSAIMAAIDARLAGKQG
jgi:dTMP kinase